MSTLEVISPHIRLLTVTEDYKLDRLLSRGIMTVPGLIRFVAAQNKLPLGSMKYAPDAFGGTSFSTLSPSGDPLLAVNHDSRRSDCLLVKCDPKWGYRSISTVNTASLQYDFSREACEEDTVPEKLVPAPLICTDGVNEMGLAIAAIGINSSPTRQTGPLPSIISSVALRAVLDTCVTAEDAIALFDRYRIRDPLNFNIHYQISDRSGSSVLIEYVNNRLQIIRPAKRTLYSMNFFQSPGGDNRKAEGYDRKRIVSETLSFADNTLTSYASMRLLNRCALDGNRPGARMTVRSVVYNCMKSSLLLEMKSEPNTMLELYLSGEQRRIVALSGSAEDAGTELR